MARRDTAHFPTVAVMNDFASLHKPGDPLLLPNAWDAASAVLLAEAQERAEAYTAADSLFVPGLVDLDAIAQLTAGPLPIAVMTWAGAPSVAEFTKAGVVRISLGAAIAQAAYAVATRATVEMLT